MLTYVLWNRRCNKINILLLIILNETEMVIFSGVLVVGWSNIIFFLEIFYLNYFSQISHEISCEHRQSPT